MRSKLSFYSLTFLATCKAACLYVNPLTIGDDDLGEPFSNLPEIEALSNPENYKLEILKNCEEQLYDDEDLVGIQFTLASRTDPSDIIELSPIGDVSGDNCRTLTLVDPPLDTIKASYSLNSESVSAIRYYKGD